MMHIARLKERAIALGILDDEEAVEFFAELKEAMDTKSVNNETVNQMKALMSGQNKMVDIMSGVINEIQAYASDPRTEWQPALKILEIIKDFNPKSEETVDNSVDVAALEHENLELWARNTKLSGRLLEVCRAYHVYEDDLVEGTKSPVLINGKLAVSVHRAAGTFESVMELTGEIKREDINEA